MLELLSVRLQPAGGGEGGCTEGIFKKNKNHGQGEDKTNNVVGTCRALLGLSLMPRQFSDDNYTIKEVVFVLLVSRTSQTTLSCDMVQYCAIPQSNPPNRRTEFAWDEPDSKPELRTS